MMKTPDSIEMSDAFIAELRDLVLPHGSDAYFSREASYWAANCPMQPRYIVEPRSTDDVSRIVKLLVNVSTSVAVRSGGHTQWTGSNDVHDGVTIDLGRMKNVTYDPKSKLTSIEPGLRWGDVYELLLDHGVCVPGGRDGNVGIGGFLTGGGNSYYAGLYGWATDSVANFEVVLADGSIVNANANSHSDLFRALKGGSGNFGIVTRFDMYTFPAHDIWGGIRVAVREKGDELAQTMIDFTDNNKNYQQDSYILNFTFNPSISQDIVIAHVVVDTDGVTNARAFESILKVPVIMDDIKTRTMANMANSYLLPGGEQQVWFTLTFYNDVRIIRKAAMMHDEMVEALKHVIPADSFSTQCLFQPIPTIFTEHSIHRGGNVMGLDNVKQNCLMWLIVGSTKIAAQEKVMRTGLETLCRDLGAYATSLGLGVDWQYLNYVDQTQDPLKSYGKMNVDFMRKVSAKYDPSGVFQSKIVSGWKISNVVHD